MPSAFEDDEVVIYRMDGMMSPAQVNIGFMGLIGFYHSDTLERLGEYTLLTVEK